MLPLNGGRLISVWQTPAEIAMQKRHKVAVRDGITGFLRPDSMTILRTERLGSAFQKTGTPRIAVTQNRNLSGEERFCSLPRWRSKGDPGASAVLLGFTLGASPGLHPPFRASSQPDRAAGR